MHHTRLSTILFGGLTFLLMLSQVQAETRVETNITGSQTWGLTGSPYILPNHIMVSNGTEPITLIIKSGVEIILSSYLDIPNNEALVVQGTEEKPAIFTSSETDKTQTGVWGGVRLRSDSSASDGRLSVSQNWLPNSCWASDSTWMVTVCSFEKY